MRILRKILLSSFPTVLCQCLITNTILKLNHKECSDPPTWYGDRLVMGSCSSSNSSSISMARTNHLEHDTLWHRARLSHT